MQLTPSDPDIQTLISRIRNGDIDLQPDFQRGEVWPLAKKRRLIDSILRNWYIPPVHTIIIKESNRQDVLDGQQRLAAIRDFMDNRFSVDGHTPPPDPEIQALDGLFYDQLPDQYRRAFDSFTIRVIRISDYKPEEPGELFYRLNQITSITSAEQRNAFYGPVRDQVKALVKDFEDRGNNQDTLGFSNSRMAYDDVISKLLCTLETKDLGSKLTSSFLSDRYRSTQPFEAQAVNIAQQAIIIFSKLWPRHAGYRLNKATLYSWLVFLSTYVLYDRSFLLDSGNISLVDAFEEVKSKARSSPAIIDYPPERAKFWHDLIQIYVDRSTSRVNDVSSVLLRDFILHFFAATALGLQPDELPLNSTRRATFRDVSGYLNSVVVTGIEIGRLEAAVAADKWGAL